MVISCRMGVGGVTVADVGERWVAATRRLAGRSVNARLGWRYGDHPGYEELDLGRGKALSGLWIRPRWSRVRTDPRPGPGERRPMARGPRTPRRRGAA
ncbi:hypothetical protein RHCRD62_30407 [Rhodococcus sp. RD6.2]|nr:hypothetical protein RHCRD62_30407 [Rhodococcus sp. RD6.2]